MITYFCLYSMLGYLMESCYISIFQKKVISSGLLKGPYIPLYGVGSVLLITLAPFLKHSVILCLIGGGITVTLLEYLSSLYIEKVFHTKCWDYSHHFMNFKGRVCIIYFILWSFLSLFFIIGVHPIISSYLQENDITLLISMVIILFIVKDTIIKLNIQKDGLKV